jgi:hypothetical protein
VDVVRHSVLSCVTASTCPPPGRGDLRRPDGQLRAAGRRPELTCLRVPAFVSRISRDVSPAPAASGGCA